MPSFKQALSKVILNLFLLSVHIAANLITVINSFSSFLKQKLISSLIKFLVYCVEYLYRG